MFYILLNSSQIVYYYSYFYMSTLELSRKVVNYYKLTDPFNYGTTAYSYHSYVCVLSLNNSKFALRMRLQLVRTKIALK